MIPRKLMMIKIPPCRFMLTADIHHTDRQIIQVLLLRLPPHNRHPMPRRQQTTGQKLVLMRPTRVRQNQFHVLHFAATLGTSSQMATVPAVSNPNPTSPFRPSRGMIRLGHVQIPRRSRTSLRPPPRDRGSSVRPRTHPTSGFRHPLPHSPQSISKNSRGTSISSTPRSPSISGIRASFFSAIHAHKCFFIAA